MGRHGIAAQTAHTPCVRQLTHGASAPLAATRQRCAGVRGGNGNGIWAVPTPVRKVRIITRCFSGSHDFGVGIETPKPWEELSERQQKVVSALGWGQAQWDANDEHPHWYADLSGSERRAAGSVGFDAQGWDTKKYLAREQREGRRGFGTALGAALSAFGFLVCAGCAWVAAQLPGADDCTPRAVFWEATSWCELSLHQQHAAAALGLDLDGEGGWESRFERAAQSGQTWLDIQADVRERGTLALGLVQERWPPQRGTPPSSHEIARQLERSAVEQEAAFADMLTGETM